jgi:hypothetical protein
MSKQEPSPKVSEAGKQQQELLASVALQLPGVLLGTAELSDPSNSTLQYVAATASELLLCCWPELGSRHAAALNTGSASSHKKGGKSSSSTIKDSSTDVGSSSSSSSRDTAGSCKGASSPSSSSSAMQWVQEETVLAVDTVLQCWCRLMQQQLQLAVTATPAATADAAPSGNVMQSRGADQGVLLDTNRLNTITCLLPLLPEVSAASQHMHVSKPWHDYGCEVLQLLEQYVRTVLAQLHCDPDMAEFAGSHSQQQQSGAAARLETTRKFHAGLHGDIQVEMCPCCSHKPATVGCTRHKQLVEVLSQLMFGSVTLPRPKLDLLSAGTYIDSTSMYSLGPIVFASCTPGRGLQQQLLSLLTTMHKRLQGCFAYNAFALVKGQGVVLRKLLNALVEAQEAKKQLADPSSGARLPASLTREHAVTAGQLVSLWGRILVQSGSRVQQLLQLAAAAAATQAAAGSGAGRRGRANSGQQPRGIKEAVRAGAEVPELLHELTGCVSLVGSQLEEVRMACGLYGHVACETQSLHGASALHQLLQLHAEAQGDTDCLSQQQQEQQPGQQQQQEQEQQQQQQQDGECPAGRQLQLPPYLPLWEGDLLEMLVSAAAAASTAQQVAVAADAAAATLSGRGQSMMPSFEGLSAAVGLPSKSFRQQLAAARSASECMAVVLACDGVLQLPQALQHTGELLCAAVPVAGCCNNPRCTNMSGVSELQLVQGRAAKCKACGSARCVGLDRNISGSGTPL